MKKLITLLVLLFLHVGLSAQSNCDCKSELKFVYEKMQTMSSFKSQIKGDKVDAFEEQYKLIEASLSPEMNKLECFIKLNQLMDQVKDKHASVYETPSYLSYESALDSSAAEDYRMTAHFKNFPSISLDLNQLKESLKLKDLEDVEGIYNVGSSLKIGVSRIDEADNLVGVVLESDLRIWEPGHIFLYLKATDKPFEYDLTFYGQLTKNLMFSKSHFIQNGILFRNIIKEGLVENHIQMSKDKAETYKLVSLSAKVQYLWIHSFSRIGNADNRDSLVAQINKELIAPHLIVDLRSNGGGASKISLPIVRALKKKRSTKLYVLTNFNTGSNAEQTTVRLKRMKGTVHLGQRTRGAIAYGMNYGTSYKSPSDLFTIIPTDMKFNQFLKYEEVGVQPDVELDPKSDWVEQTINYIDTRNL